MNRHRISPDTGFPPEARSSPPGAPSLLGIDTSCVPVSLRPRFYSLFFPLLLDLELPQAVAHAGLPGSEQIPPLRSRPFGGGYHGRGRCHILGSRGVGRDVAH